MSCKDMEATSRKTNSEVGCLGFGDFTAVVNNTFLTYKLLDPSDKEIIWPELVDLLTTFQGGKDYGSVSYEKFLVHYAGEREMAEFLLHKKWELIWTELGGRWGEVDSKELEKVLQNPKVFLFLFLPARKSHSITFVEFDTKPQQSTTLLNDLCVTDWIFSSNVHMVVEFAPW